MGQGNGLSMGGTPAALTCRCWPRVKRKPAPSARSSASRNLQLCSDLISPPTGKTNLRACRAVRSEQICDDIIEWNYGDYEGITTDTIRETIPDWTVWSHGCPIGEDAPQVEARCKTTISTALAVPGEGDVAKFAHGQALTSTSWIMVGTGCRRPTTATAGHSFRQHPWLGPANPGHSAMECSIQRTLLSNNSHSGNPISTGSAEPIEKTPVSIRIISSDFFNLLIALTS